jgi:hypothetical protein
VAIAAAQALTHEAADIQEAGWKLIERLCPQPIPELDDAVRREKSHVAPSLRERLEAWRAQAAPPRSDTEGTASTEGTSGALPSGGLVAMIREARSLPQPLAHAAKMPELLATLLELLHQLTLEVGQPIPSQTAEWLKQLSGTGKGARAVKALLAVSSAANKDRLQERNQLALQGRIDRFRRWMTTG